jgi:hypothetical protein
MPSTRRSTISERSFLRGEAGRRHQRQRWAAALGIAIAVAAWSAHGHVVFGTTTLHLLTAQSDFAARVRIVDPAAALVIEDPPLRETVVVAEVLEALKGGFAGKELRFVQHAHGIASYAEGDEVLLFVDRISKSSELATSRIAEHVQWVSEQETGAKFPLDEDSRDAVAAAVKRYAALAKMPRASRPAELRSITLEMLASPHPMLAASALRDLVLAADVPIVSADDLPALEAVLDNPETTIGIRIGLLAELERRGLVDGPPRWAALLSGSRGAQQLAVVRAAAAHPSEAVARELTKLLAADDPQLVATAAVSLGSPGNDAAVAPLAKLLTSDDSRVRMAAIRGLGKVDSPAAKQALAKAAKSHADPATQRRAAAEVKVLADRGKPGTRSSP